MFLFVTCDQCHAKAIVIRHVFKPGELSEIARALELDVRVKPYMIIGCPKCGIRAIDAPSDDASDAD
jgi:predicted nucleic-acid-binding Zn-ribbon protein